MKRDPDVTAVRHMVDVRKAIEEFREASERRHDTSSQVYRFDNNVPNRSPVQKRLSIYNWNPGPRRGNEDASEKQIAGKWHVITLQEAVEYVDHDILKNRFHVTHYGGCAVLCNKDTFFSNIHVKSIYLHDTRRDLPEQVMEGDQGWVLQGVLSRASFRRPPVSGQKYFTVLSLLVSNIYAKKKGIAKKLLLTLRAIMISQEVDLVAGDFNGAAWRCSNRNNISTMEEALLTALWQRRWVLHHCGDPDQFQTTGLTFVGCLNRLIQIGIGKYAFMVLSPSHAKLSAYAQPIKAATTRHGSTWISSIGAALSHIMKSMTDEFSSKNVLLQKS